MALVTSAAFVEVQLYAVGTILAGKYRVIRELGRGGMGAVLEAQHLQLDERVALKFLLPEFITRPEFVERFLREARAAVKIKSEHIARVSDVGTLENGAPYMVMEFLEGRDLASQHAHYGAFALEDAVDFGLQAGVALAEAHGLGIVHRDIKPANLFLSRGTDGGQLIKLLDFGISKMADSEKTDGLTKTSTTMGSVLYMSPEQMKQTKSVDHRADIYSLGISLYELLGGRQPFHAETMPELYVLVLTGTPTPLRDLRPDLPEAFARVLEKAYARLPEDRYQSMAEFARALAPFAPARSRPSLERIERLAQAQRTRGSLPSNTGPALQAQPKAMTDHGFAPPPTGMTGHGFAPPPTNHGFAAPPTAHLPAPQPVGHTVAYAPVPHGPAITGSTNANLTTTAHSKPSRTPMLLGLLGAGLAGALGAALFFGGVLGKKNPAPASAAPVAAESTAPTSKPAESTTAVATSASPEPSASATAAAPSASASSEGSASASASLTVATKPTAPRPPPRPTVALPPPTAVPPPPPPSTGNVFKDR